MLFWYLGPGDVDPVVARVKSRLGVFPITETYDDELATRLRGWRRLRGEDPAEIWIDAPTLRALGL